MGAHVCLNIAKKYEATFMFPSTFRTFSYCEFPFGAGEAVQFDFKTT